MKAHRTLRGAAAVLFVVALVAACGQRGPLYLPEEAPVEVRQNPQPATTPATSPATTPATAPAPTSAPVPQPPKTDSDSDDDEQARQPDAKPR